MLKWAYPPLIAKQTYNCGKMVYFKPFSHFKRSNGEIISVLMGSSGWILKPYPYTEGRAIDEYTSYNKIQWFCNLNTIQIIYDILMEVIMIKKGKTKYWTMFLKNDTSLFLCD